MRQPGHLPVRVGQALGKFGSTLTHAASGHILLCARKEEKMLPGTVVKEMLAEKVEAIEFEQGRALKKKEKEALKEEIMHTLLPRAFSRTSQTFAWINPADNLMVVDAGSSQEGGRSAGAPAQIHRLPCRWCRWPSRTRPRSP